MKINFIKNKPNYMYFCLCHKKFHIKIGFLFLKKSVLIFRKKRMQDFIVFLET